MAAGRGGLRGPGERKRFRWWTAAALLVAALVVGCADDDGLDGSVAFVVDGTVVAESMSVKAGEFTCGGTVVIMPVENLPG